MEVGDAAPDDAATVGASVRSIDYGQLLPFQPTPLIGRRRELAACRRELLAADCRLLTLTGTAGIGKTRLAIALEAAVAERFDGVSFVDLAPVRDATHVAGAIASAIGAKPGAGQT